MSFNNLSRCEIDVVVSHLPIYNNKRGGTIYPISLFPYNSTLLEERLSLYQPLYQLLQKGMSHLFQELSSQTSLTQHGIRSPGRPGATGTSRQSKQPLEGVNERRKTNTIEVQLRVAKVRCCHPMPLRMPLSLLPEYFADDATTSSDRGTVLPNPGATLGSLLIGRRADVSRSLLLNPHSPPCYQIYNLGNFVSGRLL